MNCPHCNVHIDEHPASRCLDAWVAEAIIGADKDKEVSLAYLGDESLTDEQKEYIWNDILPSYSASIAAAEPVIEILQRLHDNTRFIMEFDAQNYLGWTVGWFEYDHDEGWRYSSFLPKATAKTRPHAVCRLAIKATA